MVGGVLQSAALAVAPAMLLQQGTAFLEKFSQTLTPVERPAIDTLRRYLRGDKPWEKFGAIPEQWLGRPEPGTTDTHSWLDTANRYAELVRVPVRTTDVRGAEGDLISYYAAGIGVMFLLFSMAGAGASLLEEEESGTLERLLNSNLRMGTLLLGKWTFFTVIAMMQLCLMFVWGALIFGIDLWTVNHVAGFLVMALVTATAAAAFGIVFATICQTRAQLSGISTMVILLMSALGGSMAPRFVMPAFMTTVAKFTFNGWALDGFLKVFWYDNPRASLLQSLLSLWPQITVLTTLTLVLLALAYILMHRWETV
jgi:ABC-2 type transport system permease protein